MIIKKAKAQQMSREKPDRFAMKHIVHKNTFRRLDGPELREMMSQRACSSGYDEWVLAFCERKYKSDFAREMSRSVTAYLKDFKGQCVGMMSRHETACGQPH